MDWHDGLVAKLLKTSSAVVCLPHIMTLITGFSSYVETNEYSNFSLTVHTADKIPQCVQHNDAIWGRTNSSSMAFVHFSTAIKIGKENCVCRCCCILFNAFENELIFADFAYNLIEWNAWFTIQNGAF